jgi:hypothetical protein
MDHASRAENNLRDQYATEFAACPKIADFAFLPRPQARTHTSCIDSGRRCTGSKKSKQLETFYGVSVFSRLLWYHKIPKHNRYDEAHMFANNIKNELAYIGVIPASVCVVLQHVVYAQNL